MIFAISQLKGGCFMYYNSKTFYPSMKDRKIDVIGAGVSNTELIFRLAAVGANVTLHDKNREENMRADIIKRMREAGVSLSLGETYLDDLDGEIIFRTPGMYFNHPALIEARNKGKTVTSELEVFLELCPCPVFGVTGSDGKTTTTTLIAEMLRRTGRRVHLGGNIGKALLPILDKVEPNDFCVVELSSFQLMSIRSSPDVAVLTNITPNHLDVHKTMDEYIACKKNILAHQDAFSRAVISADNETAGDLAGDVRGRLVRFSRKKPVSDGAWMDENEVLYHSIGGRAVKIVSHSEMKLRGLHNVENLLAAASAVWGFVSPQDIAEVARTFSGVEHRIEPVRTRNGVQWYNDSIATSPTRMIAGLLSFEEKLIVIAGGYDKNIPFEPMAKPVIDHVKTLILTGATADKIEAVVRRAEGFEESGLEILRAADIAEAVKIAESVAKEGDIVTLSPACASFDSFPNFEARGNYYKELVNALD